MKHNMTALRTGSSLGVGFFALALLIGGLGVWGMKAKISGAIITSGLIRVETNRQVVDHETGGVVREILVRNGDVVKSGDILVRLDQRNIKSELAVVSGQLQELWARQSRYQAERDNDQELESEHLSASSDIMKGQIRLFNARKKSLNQEQGLILEQTKQLQNEIVGVEANLKAGEIQIDLINQELGNAKELLEKGLIQSSRVMAMQREQARLQGVIGSNIALIARLNGQAAELQIQKMKLRTNYNQEAISRLRDLEFNEVELIQTRDRLQLALAQMDIRAPSDGIIYGSTVFALGSLVKRGDPLMFVIPKDQPMIVAARVETTHIDQVYVGQKASLRFSTFDQRTTPEINGRVLSLSADIFFDDRTGQSYYEAELTPDLDDIKSLGDQKLLPGMPVDAFIKTSDRTPISYLLKPMTDYFQKAFRET